MFGWVDGLSLGDWGSLASIFSIGTFVFFKILIFYKDAMAEHRSLEERYRKVILDLFENSSTQLKRNDAFIYASALVQKGKNLEDHTRVSLLYEIFLLCFLVLFGMYVQLLSFLEHKFLVALRVKPILNMDLVLQLQVAMCFVWVLCGVWVLTTYIRLRKIQTLNGSYSDGVMSAMERVVFKENQVC